MRTTTGNISGMPELSIHLANTLSEVEELSSTHVAIDARLEATDGAVLGGVGEYMVPTAEQAAHLARQALDEWGTVQDDPSFVVGPAYGPTEAFAIAALSGCLPRPGSPSAPPFLASPEAADGLANTLDLYAHDQLARWLPPLAGGPLVAAWMKRISRVGRATKEDILNGVTLWGTDLARDNGIQRYMKLYANFKGKHYQAVQARLAAARASGRVLVRRTLWIPPDIQDGSLDGFLHDRLDNCSFDSSVDAWRYPVVAISRILNDEGLANLMISMPNRMVAESLLGRDYHARIADLNPAVSWGERITARGVRFHARLPQAAVSRIAHQVAEMAAQT